MCLHKWVKLNNTVTTAGSYSCETEKAHLTPDTRTLTLPCVRWSWLSSLQVLRSAPTHLRYVNDSAHQRQQYRHIHDLHVHVKIKEAWKISIFQFPLLPHSAHWDRQTDRQAEQSKCTLPAASLPEERTNTMAKYKYIISTFIWWEYCSWMMV